MECQQPSLVYLLISILPSLELLLRNFAETVYNNIFPFFICALPGFQIQIKIGRSLMDKCLFSNICKKY